MLTNRPGVVQADDGTYTVMLNNEPIDEHYKHLGAIGTDYGWRCLINADVSIRELADREARAIGEIALNPNPPIWAIESRDYYEAKEIAEEGMFYHKPAVFQDYYGPRRKSVIQCEKCGLEMTHLMRTENPKTCPIELSK